MTTYEYDGDGRLVRAVTVREPEWTAAEVSMLIASKHLEMRDSTGHLVVEATDLRANPANPDGTHYYVAGVLGPDGMRHPVHNFAEIARAQAQQTFRDAYPDVDMTGLYWPVERVERRK